jgi:hypothetical protein
MTKRKSNQNNEGKIEKKIKQHKLCLNDEIENQQSFNRGPREKKLEIKENTD